MYAYAADNPVSRIDPAGLDSVSVQSLRLPPTPNIATVICDGQGQPIAQLPFLKPIYEKCVGDCMLVHEYSNIDDLMGLGIGATICLGRPRGTVVTVPPTNRAASQRKAYAAELACLRKKLQGLSDCDECRRAVVERVGRVQQLGVNP